MRQLQLQSGPRSPVTSSDASDPTTKVSSDPASHRRSQPWELASAQGTLTQGNGPPRERQGRHRHTHSSRGCAGPPRTPAPAAGRVQIPRPAQAQELSSRVNTAWGDPADPRVLPLLSIFFYKVWTCFQVALVVKNPPANAGYIRDVGSIPAWRRCSGGEHGSPLQYPCLENPMGRGAWGATAHGVAESDRTGVT